MKWNRLLLLVILCGLNFGGTFSCSSNDDDDDPVVVITN
jgi:hypothetical protein